MRRLFDYIGIRLTGRRDFSAQYRRYRETVFWLVRELFRFDSGNTLRAIVFNVLGGILKTGALAFLLYYANLMEAGGDIDLPGYSLHARSETVFYLAVSIAMSLLLLGAFATYAGNHTINSLSIAFAAHRSRDIIASAGGRPAGNPSPSLKSYPAALSGSVTAVVRMSRTVKKLLQAANPLATLVYSLFVLFYLNALLSLMVMAVALLSLLLQYMVNYHSAQNEKQLVTSRGRGQRRLRQLLEESALTPEMHASAMTRLEKEFREPDIGGFLRCYYLRVMASPRSALVSDLLMALLSFLLVIYLGHSALLGDIGWALFLGYLLFARVSLQAFRGVLVSVTGFARHYPRARRVYEYFRSLAGEGQSVAAEINVGARGRGSIGDRKKVKMQPGSPLMILSPVPLSRFNQYAFIDALAGGNVKENNALSLATVSVSCGLDSQPGGSLNELLENSGVDSEAAIEGRLRSIGLPADVSRDDLLTPEAWQQLPQQTRARVLLQQACSPVTQLVLVDGAVLDASGAGYAADWLATISESKVGIVSDSLEGLQHFGGKVVVLMAQDRSVSVANVDWCRENPAAISDWFNGHLAMAEEDDADDDLFEDE